MHEVLVNRLGGLSLSRKSEVRTIEAYRERKTITQQQQNQSCLRSGLTWFNWLASFAPEFQCCYFCESLCLFHLRFNCDFSVPKIMHL